MNKLAPKPPSLTFADAYFRTGLTFGMLDAVQAYAQVEQETLVKMLLGQRVRHNDAQAVLVAINHLLAPSSRWLTFENVDIPLIEER